MKARYKTMILLGLTAAIPAGLHAQQQDTSAVQRCMSDLPQQLLMVSSPNGKQMQMRSVSSEFKIFATQGGQAGSPVADSVKGAAATPADSQRVKPVIFHCKVVPTAAPAPQLKVEQPSASTPDSAANKPAGSGH